jgi:DNA-binding MarR family transcriptional regulator
MTSQKTTEYWRHQVWILLHYAHDIVIKNEEDFFRRKVGVSYQQALILMAMESFEKTVTAVELARVLQRNPNTISMILDRMEKQSLVKKIRSLEDRRLVHVKMTQLGKDKLVQSMKVGNDLVRRIVKDFSEEELQVFAKLLNRIIEQAAREAGMEENPIDLADGNIKRVRDIFNSQTK